MKEYIFFMHADSERTRLPKSDNSWAPYVEGLKSQGCFGGGSSIGGGKCVKRQGTAPEIAEQIVGFIRVMANDFDHAVRLLDGNPVYEAGGTVEIRELELD